MGQSILSSIDRLCRSACRPFKGLAREGRKERKEAVSEERRNMRRHLCLHMKCESPTYRPLPPSPFFILLLLLFLLLVLPLRHPDNKSSLSSPSIQSYLPHLSNFHIILFTLICFSSTSVSSMSSGRSRLDPRATSHTKILLGLVSCPHVHPSTDHPRHWPPT